MSLVFLCQPFYIAGRLMLTPTSAIGFIRAESDVPSRRPKLNLRIKVFQLDTSITSRKVPINRFTKSIMATIPSEELVIQNSKVWDAAAKALP